MKRPRKWCEHIGVMFMMVPIPRIINGKEYTPTKKKREYWYFLKTTHQECNDFMYCPYCKTKKPKQS